MEALTSVINEGQLQFYIAKIVSVSARDDRRIQIRILPHMEEIEENELLPWWPPFFKNEVFTGKVGDLVWVVSTPEFNVGFVLGYVSKYTWSDQYKGESVTDVTFEKISDIYLEIKGKLLSYNDLIITYFDKESIQFISRENKQFITAFTNGTMHIITKEDIFMKVGNSVININEDEIALRAKNILLNGKVSLGKKPKGKVVVTTGSEPKFAVVSDEVWA